MHCHKLHKNVWNGKKGAAAGPHPSPHGSNFETSIIEEKYALKLIALNCIQMVKKLRWGMQVTF